MTRSVWEALDSDIVCREEVELQVCIQEGDVREFNVNDDWHLGNVREYLALHFGLKEEYSFVIEHHLVRRRREKSMFCKDFTLPRYISLRRGGHTCNQLLDEIQSFLCISNE